MLLRWFAAGYLETEKHFRRIMGYEHLWVTCPPRTDPTFVRIGTGRDNRMPRKSYTAEQIIGKLREAEVLLGQGRR
jgi:hypothetical protein